MNYQLIYNQLIERAKTRVLTCYKEEHHIVPLCLNPKSTETVYLTGREHFLVHWLLIRIYPENIKLKQAFGLMGFGLSHYKYKLSSVAYQEAKEKYSEAQSKKLLGKNLSKEHKKNISKGKLGGKYKNIKMKGSHCKPILQFSLEDNFIKEYPSIIEIINLLQIDPTNCLRGNSATAGGYKWKYKNQSTPEFKPKYISKKVFQLNPQTNQIIKIWDCVQQIFNELGWQLYTYLKENSKSGLSHGFKWVYEEDYKNL